MITVTWERARLNRLLKKLETLKKGRNRILTQALAPGMRIVAKEIRKGLPAYIPNDGNRSDFKEAKQAVKSRTGVVKRAADGPVGTVFGKAGSGVGQKIRRSGTQGLRKGRPGVGLSAANLHWYLIGTTHRYTKTGWYTGRMRKPKLVQRAFRRTHAQVLRITRKRVHSKLIREWSKT